MRTYEANREKNAVNELLIGDNCKIMESILQPYYSKAFKLVYIDPPYNTRTSKSYKDDRDSNTWKVDMERVIKNIHKLLRDDGLIFISIDDNEFANLRLLCDSVFNKDNFLGTFITYQAQRSNSNFINTVHEYILCYAKQKSLINNFSIRRMDIPEQSEMIVCMEKSIKSELRKSRKAAEEKLAELISDFCQKYNISWLKNYNCIDDEGNIYFASDLSVPGVPRRVDIEEINLHLAPLKTRSWTTDKKLIELYNNGLLVFRNNRPYCKKFLRDARDNAPSILNFYSRFGSRDLDQLGLHHIFDTPKPVELIKFLIRISNVKSGEYVFDCYAGSGTTGQAVLEINTEDKKKINYILIQNKERIAKKSKSYSICQINGIDTVISEITKLRLNKVYNKLRLPNILKVSEYE